MTVAELIAKLLVVPPDLPVMLPAEGGMDYARSILVVDVARHHRDWSGTPVGQYRELPDEETNGKSFSAVLVDFDVRDSGALPAEPPMLRNGSWVASLQLNDEVALLEDWHGIHPRTDEKMPLARGQVGRVIEARDPEVLIVEYSTLDGGVFALASIYSTMLLRLQHGAG